MGASTSEFDMRKVSIASLAVAVLMAALSTAPAYALGGCGPNGHRNGWGRCVWGGQNQAWCLRQTGHTAVPDGYGHLICYH
jgi:hypothetical protein